MKMDQKSSTYDPSIALWNCIFPIEESASKSGKTSPRFTMVIFFFFNVLCKKQTRKTTRSLAQHAGSEGVRFAGSPIGSSCTGYALPGIFRLPPR